MAQLFSPVADTLLRVALVAVLVVLVGFWPIRSLIEHSAYATGVGVTVEQPVPFSHKHHVGDVGIDCRYCHVSVERSSFAGLPSSETCMGCHRELWRSADILGPVRESYESGTPLRWNVVNRLPDYVYFSHQAHVRNGIGCASCHGRVDEMPLLYKTRPWHMEDCLECHRHPERELRPLDKVFDLGWKAEGDQEALGGRLVRDYGTPVKRLTDCVTCHR